MRLIYVGWGQTDEDISYVSGLDLERKVEVDHRWGSVPWRAPGRVRGSMN